MKELELDRVLGRTEEIVREIISPMAETTDKDSLWPRSGISGLQDAGLGGLVVSAEYGGLGHGLYALARVCETIGASCASTAMCFGMHCVGTAVISAKATDFHIEQFLNPIVMGEHITSLALSESGTGAQFYFPQTEISRGPKGTFIINGEKTFVTNGGNADSYVISTASSSEEGTPGTFSCLVLGADNPDLRWGSEWQGFGMRGNSSRSLEIKSARVTTKALLGKEGDQTWYVFNIVAPYFLMAMSGTYLGIATSAINEARAHLLKRRHTMSGKNLASQQILQHRLGVLWAEVERTRQFLYFAAREGDKPGNSSSLPYVLAAKAEVADCATRVTNEVMTLMGGIAYREGSVLQRNLRDARAAHVMSPTTDILRTWTGRVLLGLPLISE